MIDYYFPPLGSAGARTLGYVRYLKQFGWEPIVLTVRSGQATFQDTTLLKSIPESIDVQRTYSFEPLKVAKKLFTRAYPENRRYAGNARSSSSVVERGIRRVRRLEHWLFFPDRNVGWAPFAIGRALHIHRAQPIDIVYSTSTAVTSHLVAHVVKTILAKPWVADFQDAWADHPVTAAISFPTPLHAYLARSLEANIVGSADHVVVTADPLKAAFQRRRQRRRSEDISVIPMGYEPAVFDRIRPTPRAKFTITHFGSFYASRSPGPFLEALGKCVLQHPELSAELEVLFLGSFDAGIHAVARRVVDRWKLGDIVRFMGPVSYEDGVGLLVSSHVLLIVGDAGDWHRTAIPTKLYDYLAARRPILALLPEGPAAGIVRALGAGTVISPDRIDLIQEAIWHLYQASVGGSLTFSTDTNMISKYGWHALAGQLASVFDRTLLACSRPQFGSDRA
ncbi:MAG TPA: hypothetical protein VJT33_14980 [bacterium]|nr:hypothetical protein [bacterium]